MKYCVEFKCKRKAMGLTLKQMASIVKSDEGTLSLLEEGMRIDRMEFEKIKYNLKNYLYALDRKVYLTIRIREETLLLGLVPEEERLHILSHMAIHVSKLNMLYLNQVEDEDF